MASSSVTRTILASIGRRAHDALAADIGGRKVERWSRKKGEVGDKVCDRRLMTCDLAGDVLGGIGGVDSVRGSRRDQPQGGRGEGAK